MSPSNDNFRGDDPSEDTYWWVVRRKAKELNSDGCTGVAEFFHDCCLEHDVHWRTGKMISGEPITDRAANRRFRQCMQARSRLGVLSPMSWWRWLGVLPLTFIRWLKRQ